MKPALFLLALVIAILFLIFCNRDAEKQIQVAMESCGSYPKITVEIGTFTNTVRVTCDAVDVDKMVKP